MSWVHGERVRKSDEDVKKKMAGGWYLEQPFLLVPSLKV
jgi:hypothetical protein